MKTYLTRPLVSACEGIEAVKRTIREVGAVSPDFGKMIENGGGDALQRLVPFDYIIYMEPTNQEERLYNIWPAYHGNRSMIWGVSREQDGTILNSYHDAIVRICGNRDYGTITKSVLDKYMMEAKTEAFSLVFFRQIVQNRFLALIGFIKLKKDAYDEESVGALFDLKETLLQIWIRTVKGVRDASIIPHDSEFFSLTNLPGMQKVLKSIYGVCREDFPVLLLGETGTGKEGVADLIRRGSGRSHGPYIKINCGGIPLSLMESKLFGYQKGAFTGAEKDTPGCFEVADKGTLLLDELGELPIGAQAQLLRVLQERVIERVGSSKEIPVNVRIIAATNRNLPEMVLKRRFREDLLYRLSIFPLYIPALRERPEDIPVLLEFFILQQARRRGFVEPPKLPPSEISRLCAYPWPGNIREMQNAVIRAMLLWNGAKESRFRIEVGKNLFSGMFESSRTKNADPDGSGSAGLRMEDAERNHIRRVLGMTGGRVAGKGGAADILDMNPSTLRARMKKLGL